MALVKSEDSKKWINSFVALCSILIGFMAIRFLQQMGEWFDLEAKVGNFVFLVQGVGVVAGVVTFFSIFRSKPSASHLQEVYDELVKVVWPDKDSVVKVTIGIIIGLAIVSVLFVGVDWMFREILQLLY